MLGSSSSRHDVLSILFDVMVYFLYTFWRYHARRFFMDIYGYMASWRTFWYYVRSLLFDIMT